MLAYPVRVMFLFFVLYHLMLSGIFDAGKFTMGFFCVLIFAQYSIGGGGGDSINPVTLNTEYHPPRGV